MTAPWIVQNRQAFTRIAEQAHWNRTLCNRNSELIQQGNYSNYQSISTTQAPRGENSYEKAQVSYFPLSEKANDNDSLTISWYLPNTDRTAVTSRTVEAAKKYLGMNYRVKNALDICSAIKRGEKELLALVLPHISNDYNYAAVFSARSISEASKDLELLNMMKAAGANLNTTQGNRYCQSKPALHCCNRYCESKPPLHCSLGYRTSITRIKNLIKAGAKLNMVDENGETVLHAATEYSFNDEIIKLLIKAGANPNLENKAGLTPYRLARW
jgi:hypothetical protein